MHESFLPLLLSAARCDRIEAVRWQRGGARDAGPQLERMNRREVDYFQQYSRILTGYIEATGVDVTAVSHHLVSWLIPSALRIPYSSSKRVSRFNLSPAGYSTSKAWPSSESEGAKKLWCTRDKQGPSRSQGG